MQQKKLSEKKVNLLSIYSEEDRVGYAVFQVNKNQKKLINCGKFFLRETENVDSLLDLLTEYEPKVCVLNTDFFQEKPKDAITPLDVIKHILFIFLVDVYEVSSEKVYSEIEKNNILTNDIIDFRRLASYHYGIIPMNDDIAKAIVIGHYMSNKI